MTDRIPLFRAFEKRFRKPKGFPAPSAPAPILAGEVDALEQTLQCSMPGTYREFITEVGPCEVRGLCDSWLFNAQGENPVPFEKFWTPKMIITQLEYEWYAPIPAEVSGGDAVASDVAWKYLIPFAGDGGGNWHCFRRRTERSSDAPVYYFDHDGGEIEQIADGLESLIREYMRLPDVE